MGDMSAGYRPVVAPSGKAVCMTRQVALGAVVAFFATVIALSVWEPKNVIAPAPAPAPASAPAPAPPPTFANPKAFKPAMFRPEGIRHTIRAPVQIAQPMLVPSVDAGTP